MKLRLRDDQDDGPVHTFVNPYVELNAGLWSLFAGATFFLWLRLYVKITRRHGMWYDDYILLVSWVSTHRPSIPKLHPNRSSSSFSPTTVLSSGNSKTAMF